jgi:glycosyltransferase involved in cell wall biosynthesis
MKVTFVVCTRDRARTILQALNSILRAIESAPNVVCEIIVVDNGSKDLTGILLKEWEQSAAQTNCDVKLISHCIPGLAGSRNMGLAESSGDIIVFTDDDCVISENYLIDLAAHYASGTELVIRGGRVELGSPEDFNFTTKTDDHASRLTYPVHPGGFVHGCNMTCNRAVIDQIGGFDVAFGAGALFRAAEDTDFIYRCWIAGIPVEYVPDMSVQHFHGRREASTIRRLHWDYHFGNGALYAKHIARKPSLYKHLYWAARSAIQELFGGPRFDESLGLSWRSIVAANVSGFLVFYCKMAQEFLKILQA